MPATSGQSAYAESRQRTTISEIAPPRPPRDCGDVPPGFLWALLCPNLPAGVYSKPVSSSLAIFVLYYLFRPRSPRKVVETVAYSTFLSALDGGTVTKVIFPSDGNGPYRFFVKDLPDVVHSTMNPHISSALQSQLKKMNIKFFSRCHTELVQNIPSPDRDLAICLFARYGRNFI